MANLLALIKEIVILHSPITATSFHRARRFRVSFLFLMTWQQTGRDKRVLYNGMTRGCASISVRCTPRDTEAPYMRQCKSVDPVKTGWYQSEICVQRSHEYRYVLRGFLRHKCWQQKYGFLVTRTVRLLMGDIKKDLMTLHDMIN